MDFFKAQEQARKKTRWLVVLFGLAVVSSMLWACLGYSLLRFALNDRMWAALVFWLFVFIALACIIYTWFRVIADGEELDENASTNYGVLVFIILFCFIIIILFGIILIALMSISVSGCLFILMCLAYIIFMVVRWIGSQKVICYGNDWLLLIVTLIIFVLCGMILLNLLISDSTLDPFLDYLDYWTFGIICAFVGVTIVVVSLYVKMTISRGGGRFIAEQLGGRRIMRNTSDPTERRLLNVIDEMSIAAGIPAPVAFVLDNEHGLNAFAAGLTTRDSVIGVTHGLLKAMTRDELQGVIAHEISHIANGDARLNLKLISYLYGISGIGSCGRELIFVGSLTIIYGVVLIPLGLFWYLVGFIGLFFVRLIQATISREREYLADAAAVQFTRYPAGLASALRKLQASGSQIEHPEAMVASHLFFGVSDTSVMDFLFATHPPLTGRILRLGGLMKPQPGLPKKISPKSLKDARTLLMPKTLRQKSHSITGATGILAGLLFARQSNIRAQQEKMLPLDALPVAQEVYQWLAKRSEHGARYRLVWLDLILPTLQEALEAERDHLLVLAKDLIRADGRVSPTEFAFYSILRSVLLSPHERRVKQSELRLGRLDKDISDILALLAYSGHEDVKAAEAAYQAAIASSPASTKHPLPAKNELSLNKISEALSHLALAAPPYRKKLLEACTIAVQHDGKITPVENELLRAFAQSLDCPAPPTTRLTFA